NTPRISIFRCNLFWGCYISVEEENVVYQKEEEVDLEDISQIQDVVLREKLLSITRLISNIESLNDNPTPDRVLNSSISIPIFEESDSSLSGNLSPEFDTFCDHTEETRSGNTTHRLINAAKNNISDDSSRDPLLEEADLFLASDNSIPSESEDTIFDPGFTPHRLKFLVLDICPGPKDLYIVSLKLVWGSPYP
nr:hypothetical protein [Tanacetum cinerariifolium]